MSTDAAPRNDRAFYAFNAVLSTGALAFLAWILVVRRGGGGPVSTDLAFLPAVNASLNATCATFLVAGYVQARRRNLRAHKFCMVAAFAASALFLVSYVVYHYVHGDTRFAGTGALRAAYLFILATHVLLSIGVVPLVLTTLWLAANDARARHRAVARWTLPIWLYVSVTGVLVYLLAHVVRPG